MCVIITYYIIFSSRVSILQQTDRSYEYHSMPINNEEEEEEKDEDERTSISNVHNIPNQFVHFYYAQCNIFQKAKWKLNQTISIVTFEFYPVLTRLVS